MRGGYGRGWAEEKAVGRWNRFLQYMREPASDSDVVILLGIMTGLMSLMSFLVVVLIR